MSQPIIEQFREFLDRSLEQRALKKTKAAQFIYPFEKTLVSKTSKNIFFEPEAQFFWKIPKKDTLLHTLGRVDFQKVFDFNQLILNRDTFSNLKIEFTSNLEPSELKRVPLFFGNFEFAPFSNDSIWSEYFNINCFIPKLLLLLDKANCYLVYNFSLENEKKDILDEFSRFWAIISAPEKKKDFLEPTLGGRKSLSRSNWKELVDKALTDIREGTFSKVVLSRKTEFDFNGQFDLDRLNQIAEKYPDCVTFFNKQKDSLFFGVSPERLLKISDGIVETESLAGSIKRSANAREDILLSEQLLKSSKNLHEQQLVTDYITAKLEKYSYNITFNNKPELVKLENIQHLKTKFKALLKNDKFFYDLIKELHPTPAVCGFPKEAALNFILKNEGYERGLYSGIAGWFNLFEEGEFAVAIRSALINRKKLYTFSGCGIVEGSDAESEYEETEIKLKPILTIFGYED
jgi:menaquinone-specific isochorismate synthase